MKVEEVKRTEEEVSYKLTLEISEDELRYIWHRLNIRDTVIKEHYKRKDYLKLAKKIGTYDIWEMFDKILYGE